MRRILPLAIALLFAPACELEEPNPTDSTGPLPAKEGVQVGSEGIIPRDCITNEVTPTTRISALGGTVEQLTEGLSTPRTVQLDPSSAVGELILTPIRYTVVEEGACPASLVIELTASLELGTSLSTNLTGFLSIGTDAVGRMSVESPTWEGDLEPSFAPAPQRTVIQLMGELDPTFTGELSFIGCTGTDCETELIGTLTERS